MYPFAPYSQIIKNMPEIKASEVSKRAREKGQFLEVYRDHGRNLPRAWAIKRDGFIKRTLASYIMNKTRRRQLALLVWAYKV